MSWKQKSLQFYPQMGNAWIKELTLEETDEYIAHVQDQIAAKSNDRQPMEHMLAAWRGCIERAQKHRENLLKMPENG